MSSVRALSNTALRANTISKFPPQCRNFTQSATKSVPKPASPDDSVPPAFNIWRQIQKLSRPARYTIYAGLGLMSVAESTFWTKVIYNKYFAPADKEDDE